MQITPSNNKTSFCAIKVDINNPIRSSAAQYLTKGAESKEILRTYLSPIAPDLVEGLLGQTKSLNGKVFETYLFPEETSKLINMYSSIKHQKSVSNRNNAVDVLKQYLKTLKDNAQELNLKQQKAVLLVGKQFNVLSHIAAIKVDMSDKAQIKAAEYLTQGAIDKTILEKNLQGVAPEYISKLLNATKDADGNLHKIYLNKESRIKIINLCNKVNDSVGNEKKLLVKGLKSYLMSLVRQTKQLSAKNLSAFETSKAKYDELRNSLTTKFYT